MLQSCFKNTVHGGRQKSQITLQNQNQFNKQKSKVERNKSPCL
jgi:hypothetical protein